ncbi:MAG: ribonuclease E inhibitor RraB [Verrucomicrobia bacterium]|nr:ribonuclease E inhibitor RraB [Verrucomicrobiota bacterium]
MKATHHRLIEVLHEARKLLGRSGNNFSLASWEDATAAFREIDSLISRIESGELPNRTEIETLFLASGPIQRVSVPSDWGDEFLTLASRFDAAILKAYRVDSSLEGELAKDESLWQQWQESGVTENTTLSVDFFFHTTDETAAQKLADTLRQAGMSQIQICRTRTLWMFKKWEVSAVKKGTWSLEKLQDQTRAFCDLAAKLGIRYDGCGAMIPDNETT